MSEQRPQRPAGPIAGRGFFGPAMGPPAQRSKDFRASAYRLVGRLRPELPRLAVVLACGVASVTFLIVGPKILGHAINILFEGIVQRRLPAGATQAQVIASLRAQGRTRLADLLSGMTLHPGQGVDYARIEATLAWLALVYVLSALFAWIQQYVMAGVAQRTLYRLREDVDHKLARLPLRYFDEHPRGDLLSRVTNDIDNIASSLQQGLTQIVTSVLTILGVLIMMLTISPLLALVSLIAVPLSFGVTVLIAKRSQRQFVAQWKRTGDVDGYIEEMFTGHDIVKVFGKQQTAIESFDRQNEALYQASFRAQFISGTIQPSTMFISNLNYVAIAVIGGLRVTSGAMSLGDVVAFIQYSRQFTQPIIQVASIANVLQSAVASAERVFELLDEAEEDPDPLRPSVLEHSEGHITLSDVSFRYRPEMPLIERFDLDVPAGHTIAIVGPTGAGKTTLVNLLLRFYEIDAGTIAVDGVDARRMTRSGLRRLFGMVLQDPWLFNGSIRENIAYGREGATDEEVHAAARTARVDHLVLTTPDGYDTVIDDEASNLSQGERQLLTIARAFLADPDVLILDEATSSVDTRTEVLIQQAMAELMRNRTSFVIAHRLSTIRNARTIIVMNHGRIVEQGTHEELLARGGFYHDLYESQFAAAVEEEPTRSRS